MPNVSSFFVKKLPAKTTEADLRAAFTPYGAVQHVKVLKGRRAFIDVVELDASTAASISIPISAGFVNVLGVRCPVGINTSLAGVASEPDERQLIIHECSICQQQFASARKLAAHLSDGSAHRAPPPAWTPSRLDEFDLASQAMVSMLDDAGRSALDYYLAHALPQWPEMPCIVAHIATRHPTSLRVKELVESVECFRLVGQFFYERWKQRGLTTLLDLACGHGLVGVLLAYRFPQLRVVCVDLERRRCWAHYQEAWGVEGRAAEGHAAPLDNLTFREADVADVTRWDARAAGTEQQLMGPHTAVVCCHACNEANLIVLQAARQCSADWAVMPCCLPDGIYGFDCRKLADDGVRYSIMIGLIAGQFNAAKVRLIDRRITNRNLLLLGPSRTGGTAVSSTDVLLPQSGRTHRFIAPQSLAAVDQIEVV